ncbi:MAG: lipid-A-disaccharide synthase [Verrucomicrobiota bacterium]|nr:lipid-A-disaccharide synthase [Verrucomicrobiota bacterium]
MGFNTFMIVAGEASGDLLAAELVSALSAQSLAINPASAPRFFGAGGPKMAGAGVELAFDMTRHAVIGISDVLKHYFKFRRLFRELLTLAVKRRPQAIIGVDYGGFNLRFGHAVRNRAREHPGDWDPKFIQFVSPQVWASRPGRAKRLATDCDLLLSIFPFEKDWYGQRAPTLRVEFVGHPMVERLASARRAPQGPAPGQNGAREAHPAGLLLLPGSRVSELKSHLPVMLGALELLQPRFPGLRAKMVLPDPTLKDLAEKLAGPRSGLELQTGRLPEALAHADAAIASTGTVTMECAFFGVPTVTLYKTSWFTYQIARRIVTVKSLTMPNLLAGEEVYPEFIQGAATPETLSRAVLDLLRNEARRQRIKSQLAGIISSLGGPGASARAAAAILSL